MAVSQYFKQKSCREYNSKTDNMFIWRFGNTAHGWITQQLSSIQHKHN